METVNASMGFQGTIPGKLDDKNRLTLPAAWRDALTSGARYTAFFNPLVGFIVVYPSEQWRLILKETSDPVFQLLNPDVLLAVQKLNSESVSLQPDDAGRFVWPKGYGTDLLERAGITGSARDVEFLGIGANFGIRSRDNAPAPDSESASAREFLAALGKACGTAGAAKGGAP
jgi:DNA-binding transcriptional regulator/RsmH inhibitor MraZ